MSHTQNHPVETKPLTGQTVTLIHESDFSALVRQLYGRPYQVQQQNDCYAQDAIIPFTVTASDEEAEGGEWYGPTLEEWAAAPPPDESNFEEITRWHRKFYPEFEAVVADLHKRGLIAAGQYALHVWW